MNPRSLDQRQRRVLAVGLLVGLVLAVGLFVVQPLVGVFVGYTAAIDDAQFRLKRYRAVAAQLPALRREVNWLEKRIGASGLFLEKRTPDLAAVELQQYLEGVVDKQGGDIQSVQVMSPIENKMNTRIRLRTSLRADSTTLSAIYRALETSKPVTFINNVNVSPVQARRVKGPKAGRLEVRFELSGYVPGVKG